MQQEFYALAAFFSYGIYYKLIISTIPSKR